MKSSERGNYFAKGHTAVYSRATIWTHISWLQDQSLYCTFLIFFFLLLISSHPPFFQLPVVISLKWKYELLVIVLVTFSLYSLSSNSIANNKRNKSYMASTWTNQESHHYQKPQNMKYMPHIVKSAPEIGSIAAQHVLHWSFYMIWKSIKINSQHP